MAVVPTLKSSIEPSPTPHLAACVLGWNAGSYMMGWLVNNLATPACGDFFASCKPNFAAFNCQPSRNGSSREQTGPWDLGEGSAVMPHFGDVHAALQIAGPLRSVGWAVLKWGKQNVQVRLKLVRCRGNGDYVEIMLLPPCFLEEFLNFF